MATTLGDFAYGTALTTVTTGTVTTVGTHLGDIASSLTAADANWTITTAAATYATNSQFLIMTHSTSGAKLVLCGACSTSAATTMIDAANSSTGAAILNNGSNIVNSVFASWLAPGASTPTNDPSNATFFGAVTDMRFQRLVPLTNSYTATQRRVHVGAAASGAIWICYQSTPATPTTLHSLLMAGPDIYGTLVQSGDTYGMGQFALGTADASVTLSTTSSFAGQCRKASGSALCNLTGFDPPGGSIGATVQAASPYVPTPMPVFRAAADIATTGVINNNGVKGLINPYFFGFVPTATGNKVTMGLGTYIALVGGLMVGWKATNAPMS